MSGSLKKTLEVFLKKLKKYLSVAKSGLKRYTIIMRKNHPGAARHPSKEGNLSRAALISLLGGSSADGGVVFCCYGCKLISVEKPLRGVDNFV